MKPPPPTRPSPADEAELLASLCTVRDPAELRRIMGELLTPSEYAALLRRWTILKMLSDGHTQRETARAIGGSLCNVTRGARVLRTGTAATLKLLRPSASV